LKENFKVINEGKGFELMQNHIGFLEHNDNIINQQPSHVFHDPVACYMEGFISSGLQPLVNYEFENKDDEELVLHPTLFACP
jgi:hypothetical protein